MARADRTRLATSAGQQVRRRARGGVGGPNAHQESKQETHVSPTYRLTPGAQADVANIGEFIAEDSVDAALLVLDALESAFGKLAATPHIGHKREDLTVRPLKFWGVYSYLIVYDPSSTPLTVIAVLHGARDIERLLRT